MRAPSLTWLRAHPALKQPLKAPRGQLSTSYGELDALLGGGLPCGAICEVVGAKSSGRTSLILSVLGAATTRGDLVAWVDPHDALDVQSAEASGVILSRFLWVRPEGAKAAEQALQATDLLVDAGSFHAVALDLSEQRRAFSEAVWVRLVRRLVGKPTALIVLSPQDLVGASAHVRLVCQATTHQQTQVSIGKLRGGAPGSSTLIQLGHAVE